MVPRHGSAPPGQDLQLTSGLFWSGACGMLPYFPEYCALQNLWQLLVWLSQCPKSRYLLSAQKSRVWCFLKLFSSVFLLCQADGQLCSVGAGASGYSGSSCCDTELKRHRLRWKVLGQGTGSQALSEEESWSRMARAGSQKGERLT